MTRELPVLGRRVQVMTISPDSIVSMLSRSAAIIIPGTNGTVDVLTTGNMPLHSRALRAGIDHLGNVTILIENDAFPLVDEGAPPPTFHPLMVSRVFTNAKATNNA